MRNLSVSEFNHHLKHVNKSTRSFNLLYEYCLTIMKKFLINKYGYKEYLTRLNNVPHDAFTKMMIENTPKKYIEAPSAYICRSADNYAKSMYGSRENNTVELNEECACSEDIEEELEFTSAEAETAWKSLDAVSRKILKMNVLDGLKLTEVSDVMGLRSDYVRTKKCRAVKVFKKALNRRFQL